MGASVTTGANADLGTGLTDLGSASRVAMSYSGDLGWVTDTTLGQMAPLRMPLDADEEGTDAAADAEAATAARMRAQRAEKFALQLDLSTTNATETALLQRSQEVARGHTLAGMPLTADETVQALRAVKRAYDRRLGTTKTSAQRLVDGARARGAAMEADKAMGPWRTWEYIANSVLNDGLAQKAFLQEDDARSIKEATDPEGFRYAVKHLRAMLRRQAKRLLAVRLQSPQEFRPKLVVLHSTNVLQTDDPDLAQEVADALAHDVAAVARQTLRGRTPGRPGPADFMGYQSSWQLVNLVNRLFAARPSMARVSLAWFMAIPVVLRFLYLHAYGVAVHNGRLAYKQTRALQMIEEVKKMKELLDKKCQARVASGVGMDNRMMNIDSFVYTEFRYHLPIEFAKAGFRSDLTFFGESYMYMTWCNKAFELCLTTFEKRYLGRSKAEGVRVFEQDLRGFRSLPGPCPTLTPSGTVLNFASVLAPGSLPLGYRLAIHRFKPDVVYFVYDLCVRAGQPVMGVDNFCIDPDGKVHCVHWSSPAAGCPTPSLQPPWLYDKPNQRAALDVLIRQVTLALFRLRHFTHSGSYRENVEMFASMFSGLGSLHLVGGANPPVHDHYWFQAGAIVLDAILGVSSYEPNFETYRMDLLRLQALVASAVDAMNKALRPAQQAHAEGIMDCLPLLALDISAPVLNMDIQSNVYVDPAPPAAPPRRDARFAILFTEMIGEPAPSEPGSVVGHALYTITKFSDMFGLALLQRMASIHDAALYDVSVSEDGLDFKMEFFTTPAPRDFAPLWLKYKSLDGPEARALLVSTGADKVVLSVGFRNHKHVLVISVSHGTCMHFDPHGSDAYATDADRLEAWFCNTLAQAWGRPMVFHSVTSWCTLQGPQSQVCDDSCVLSWTFRVDIVEYLRGSCKVWAYWFACLLLHHDTMSPLQALQEFYDELQRRQWTSTLFLKHYLDDVVAYLKPYVVHKRALDVYCIASRVVSYHMDCTDLVADEDKFQLLKLFLAANGMEAEED